MTDPDAGIATQIRNIEARYGRTMPEWYELISSTPARRPGCGRLGLAVNALFTHRVRVASASDIDAELHQWLRAAYTSAG
jgi:hypothetical protein